MSKCETALLIFCSQCLPWTITFVPFAGAAIARAPDARTDETRVDASERPRSARGVVSARAEESSAAFIGIFILTTDAFATRFEQSGSGAGLGCSRSRRASARGERCDACALERLAWRARRARRRRARRACEWRARCRAG
eukprot:31379-Pelagococcus_subviridis.AAC.10